MEGNNNWRPNGQGGGSLSYDRKKVVLKIFESLKKVCHKHSVSRIYEVAVKIEEDKFSKARDLVDHVHKVDEYLRVLEQRYIKLNSSSANNTNTLDPAAQVLNQGQYVSPSFPYAQTPTTSQQFLPQNIQSNVKFPGSSGLPTQVPAAHDLLRVAVAQNVNIQMDGLPSNLLPGTQRQMQGRRQLFPQQQQQAPQQQPQNSNYMLQQQMDQELVKEKIRHGNLRPPHMQPAQLLHNQQSLLMPTQQQLPQQTSSTFQKSFADTSPLSGQQSQINGRYQILIQQTPIFQQGHGPSQEQKQLKQEQLLGQQMNGPDMQLNHLTSQHNSGEQQKAFRLPSHQNNFANFQQQRTMAQQNNLHNMHQTLLSSPSNASALPSQQQQKMFSSQPGNFNVPSNNVSVQNRTQQPGVNSLGNQGQEVQQRQPQHPVQLPQDRALLQHTHRFHAAGSLRQTQNVEDQEKQPHQSLRNLPPNSCDSVGKTVHANSGDSLDKVYQEIKALKEIYWADLTSMYNKSVSKLQEIDSLPQENKQYEQIERLRQIKVILNGLKTFLEVPRSSVTEQHRQSFSSQKELLLRMISLYRRQIQQQGTRPMHQAAQSQSSHQTNSQLLPKSMQSMRSSSPLSSRFTSQTGCVLLPSLKQNPTSTSQVVDSNNGSVRSSMIQQQQQKDQLHNLQMQQQLLPKQQQHENQHLQTPSSHQTNEMNDVRMKQGLLQQHLSSNQRQISKSPAVQMSHFPSPQLDQQVFIVTVDPTETPSQSGGPPLVEPSPLTSGARSQIPGDSERPISVESSVSHENNPQTTELQTTAQFPSSVVVTPSNTPETTAERPIDRLIRAIQASTPKYLAEAVSEMNSFISMTDQLAASGPVEGSGTGVGDNLSIVTKCRLKARKLSTNGVTNPAKKLKRSFSPVPQDMSSLTSISSDSYKKLSSLEPEAHSTASSNPENQPSLDLLQEIKDINWRLIETVLDICDEDVYPSEVTSREIGEGTIVRCSYVPVALCSTFKAHYNSGKVSQIRPLRLLVPANYPESSPIVLDKIPSETSNEYWDLSSIALSKFNFSLKKLSEPILLKAMAQTWNDSIRATMLEYTQRFGGGTFSSKYGPWETVPKTS